QIEAQGGSGGPRPRRIFHPTKKGFVVQEKVCEKVNKALKTLLLYPNKFKNWEFSKAGAPGLAPSKQSSIGEIGAMQRGLKMGMLAQAKTNS
ncbi:hypothetical protein, partial [Candidatus Neptunochlamydia vexilliferae]